jgi:hypothetical protein
MGLTNRTALAAAIGFGVDYFGTFLAAALFRSAVASSAGATSAEDFVTIVEGSLELQVALLVLGLSLTVIGAFVAAWIATGNERAAAFAVGIMSTLIAFVELFAAPESGPFWAVAVGLLLTIPAAFVGGEARRAMVRMGTP